MCKKGRGTIAFLLIAHFLIIAGLVGLCGLGTPVAANVGGVTDEWPMARHDARCSGYSMSSAPNSNVTLWNQRLASGGFLAVANGTVYVAGQSVFALDATTGRILWNYPLPAYANSPAVCGGILVLTLTNGQLLRLNATREGISARERTLCYNNLGNEIDGPPTVADGVIYVGSRDGTLWAVDLETNATKWCANTRWLYSNNQILSYPSVYNGTIYLSFYNYTGGLYNSNLWAFNSTNGKWIWYTDFEDLLSLGPSTIANGMVYTPGDSAFWAFDSTNGRIVWSSGIRESWSGAAVLPSNRRLYIVSEDSSYLRRGVYGINADYGWDSSLGHFDLSNKDRNSNCPPVVADDKIFVSDLNGMFYALNPNALLGSPDALLWSFKAGGDTTTVYSPAIAYGRVYLCTSDGNVYCIGASSPPQRQPVHDVVISYAGAHDGKSVLCRDCAMKLDLSIENLGDFDENSVLTTFFVNNTANNRTLIGCQTVGLTILGHASLQFVWNSTHFVLGVYELDVNATVSFGAVELSSDIFIGGNVTVSMKGDINGPNGVPDGVVDLMDLGLVAHNYNKNVSPTAAEALQNGKANISNKAKVVNYYGEKFLSDLANCDLSGPTRGLPDGKIDITDTAMVAKHLGQHA